MSPRPVVCFWTGSPLSWLEQLSIRSHQAHGHEVILYKAGDIGRIPDGVSVRFAKSLCPPPFDIDDGARKPVAVYSDLLRLAILRETSAIWCDMDAITVAPLGNEDILVGTGPNGALTGVLALPPTSQVLLKMQSFVTSKNPVPPWNLKPPTKDQWSILDLPWGSSGPKALDHFLKDQNLTAHLMHEQVFYPLFAKTLNHLHTADVPDAAIVGETTRSVHVFGFNRIWLALANRGLPRRGSWLARMCRLHQIMPQDAPIVIQPWMWDTPVGREIRQRQTSS